MNEKKKISTEIIYDLFFFGELRMSFAKKFVFLFSGEYFFFLKRMRSKQQTNIHLVVKFRMNKISTKMKFF